MRLYLVLPPQEQLTEARWLGSKAEAASARAVLVAKGVKRKDIATHEVDVPTNKEGLLSFLNLLMVSPSIAVAAEKLLQK